MYTAQKGNRLLKIDETKADDYIADGYTVRTTDGDLIGEPVTNDSLKEKLNKAYERIAFLESVLEKNGIDPDGKTAAKDTKKKDTKKDETKKEDEKAE